MALRKSFSEKIGQEEETPKVEKGFSPGRRDFLVKAGVGVVGAGLFLYGLDRLHPARGGGAGLLSSLSSNAQTRDKPWKWSREAEYYETDGSLVRCRLCPNLCSLADRGRGICRTRENFAGKLYTLTYGNPCSIHVDPIEKKPLYHFLPGTKALSLATAGCNLRCKFCQNWEIAQSPPEETRNMDLMPEVLAEQAAAYRARDPSVKSLAYTYSEPVAFYEYMVDSSKISGKGGIRNVVITAGYINEEPLVELCKVVDSIKIDLKGYNKKFYRKIVEAELEGVLDAIKVVHEQGVWMEIVNLVVPTLNDDMGEIRDMCQWLFDAVGSDVPLHFSRFHPDYQLQNLPPTPMETLKQAYNVARQVGLNYVYIGNVPHGDYENTYCPRCRELLIERRGYNVKAKDMSKGKCPSCGEKIAGVWK